MDAESIVLLAALLEELGVGEVRLRLSSLGGCERPRGVPRAAQAPPARPQRAALRGGARAYRAEPAARVRLRTRGHARAMAERPAPARSPRHAGRPRTSRRCARCSTRRGWPTRSTPRWCAAWTTTRARCLSSPPRSSARRAGWAAAGATTAWSGARRPTHPRDGLGGGDRADAAGGRHPRGGARCDRVVCGV